jgi:putative spermidine/putrescine transport system permease protein
VRWLLTPALLVVAVFAAALSALLRYSVLEFVPGSLQAGGLTVANFTGIMSRQYLGAVWDTVLLSAATTALTLVASYPVAYVLARTPSARVRSTLLVLTLAPFFTGAIVRTYAWMLVLGNTVITWPVPMLFTARGVLVGLVHFSMPTMILLLAAAISHVDPLYERAAASLGASPGRVFRRVTLPLLRPGLLAALLFAVIVSLNEFVVSLFISTRLTEILPVAMFTYVVNYTDPTIAALSTLFIVGTFVIVWLADRFLDLGGVFLHHR